MLGAHFSPLAPAAILLLGAFILPLVALQLPARWQAQPWLRYFSAPALVGLAALALLGIRLTFGSDATGQGLELLSGWSFSTAETVAALTIRADTFSLPFLLLAILILLAVTLATPLILPNPANQEENISDLAIWLALGAGACFLFVSANGLTLVYSVLAFDVLTMFYWLQRGYRELSISRILLGLFSVAGLTLANLSSTADAPAGTLWLGLVLWLRLGLYPFIEANVHARWQDYGALIYFGLSLLVGIYLVTRMVVLPITGLIPWLVISLVLLNSLLAYLSDERPTLLARLLIVEIGLMLLVAPLESGIITAYSVGLILSVVVLWITPRLGQPRLNERAWSWPYLPAVAATLTLISLPFSLGWLARTTLYETLLLKQNNTLLFLVILAESLAFSGLVRYWLNLWTGDEYNQRRSMVGIIAMVPFLIPALAPIILATLTQIDLPSADFEHTPAVFFSLMITIVGAVGLGYFRPRILARLKISPLVLDDFASLSWLMPWWAVWLNWVGKSVLRIRVILEGQHYMGWALFTALVGILMILLRR